MGLEGVKGGPVCLGKENRQVQRVEKAKSTLCWHTCPNVYRSCMEGHLVKVSGGKHSTDFSADLGSL